jgi:hypothetical protein
MATSKIEVIIGDFSFRGEGEPDWLTTELYKMLDHLNISSAQQQTPADFSGDNKIGNKTLAKFLKEKKATTNQVEKFLVTAAWLEARGKKRLFTRDVTAALKKASQKGLTNASDCLNQNIGKGFCEKDKSEFFVTQEGKDHLGSK